MAHKDRSSCVDEMRKAPTRRSFVAVVGAIVTGAIATLTPLGAGLATFFSPLRRKATSSEVRVALLEQVPDDGVPRMFSVMADRVDAWNRYPAQRIGAVYLLRNKGEATPMAFTAKCPHAGCFIGYTPGDKEFKCPCHTSAFKLDGKRAHGDAEVAPRDMDTLTVALRLIDPAAATDEPAADGPAAAGAGRRVRRRQRGRVLPAAADVAAAPASHVEVWVDFVDYQTGHKERIPTV
jgi:menaquinol-cytochrome c reductase iron-sulfur subunit